MNREGTGDCCNGVRARADSFECVRTQPAARGRLRSSAGKPGAVHLEPEIEFAEERLAEWWRTFKHTDADVRLRS